MRKFAINGKCGTIIGLGCFFGRGIVAKAYALASARYAGNPLAPVNSPSNTLKAALAIASHSPVSGVLSGSRLAKVRPTIIERIVIYMVHFFAFGTAKYHAMHSYLLLVALSGGSEIPTRCAPRSVPIPLRKPFKICRVNNGELALRKWNKAVRFINGLSYFLPGNLVRSALHGAAILA